MPGFRTLKICFLKGENIDLETAQLYVISTLCSSAAHGDFVPTETLVQVDTFWNRVTFSLYVLFLFTEHKCSQV